MQRFRRPALVLAAYLGTFLASLDISIVNVALPTLQQALHTDMAGLQWVINAYAIALSAVMLSAGPLGDRYGHRRMWLLSVATFTVGSLLCACAGSLSALVVGRAVQGVAGALLIPSAMPILSHAFPEAHARARVIGGWSAFSALALVLGPLLGGELVQRAGWPGIFLSIVALAALSYGLIAIGEHGLLAPATLLALGIAAAGLALFGRVERRVARPLLPLDLLAIPGFGVLNLASFVLGFTAYASLFFLSLFFQQAQGHGAAQAGAQLVPQFVLMAVVSLLFGRLAAWIGLRTALVAGYALTGMALCAIATFRPTTAPGQASALLMLLGTGMGLAVPATGMAVMSCVPVERAGIASATMNALRQAGMSLGIALLGSLMSLRAVQQFAAAAQASGQPAMAAQARALTLHPALPLPGSQAQAWYRSAMASGFGWAMTVAGVLALLAAFALYRQRTPG